MSGRAKKTGMRVLTLIAAVVVALVVTSSLPPTPRAAAANSDNFHFRHPAQGALASYRTCPNEGPLPPNTTVCEEYVVWYLRTTYVFGGGALGMAQQPFVAALEHFTYDANEPRVISYEYGETTDVVGSYDKPHLSSAHFDSATIEMNEVNLQTGEVTPTGETLTLGPFTWTAATGIYRYGNDGPALEFYPPNVRDRCHTTVSFAHQKFRVAHVTGSVEGLQLDTLYPNDWLPDQPENTPGTIFNNWYHVIDVAHGGKNCL